MGVCKGPASSAFNGNVLLIPRSPIRRHRHRGHRVVHKCGGFFTQRLETGTGPDYARHVRVGIGQKRRLSNRLNSALLGYPERRVKPMVDDLDCGVQDKEFITDWKYRVDEQRWIFRNVKPKPTSAEGEDPKVVRLGDPLV